MARTYDQFHITISVKEPDTCVVKAKSKMGTAETQTKLPFDEKKLKEKLERFALLARGATPVDGELREFGQELHKILFRDAVWELFKKTTIAAEHAGGLLIELDIQSPKLRSIPWELLHDGTDFLAMSKRTPVVRSIPSSQDKTTGDVKPIELPVRILFVAAKPRGEAPLNLGSQVRQLCRALGSAMQEGAATLHPALGDEVQPERFRAAIRDEGYHVLHISTHGAFIEQLDRGFVLLQDGMGETAPLAINTLAGMIRDTSIQLVYLDACETATGSSLSENLLVSGVSAALAMQFPIREDLATRFSETFYQYLMKGEPIWYAVTEARIALRDPLGRETLDWATPVLFIRDDYTPSFTRAKQASQRFGKTEPPSPFVGREEQLDEFAEKLLRPSTRIVLVHGFGGIGKSRLIQKILSEIELLFEDSCLVDCRGVKEIAQIVPKINEMLSIHAAPILSEEFKNLSETGKLKHICSQLDTGKFLLVLDNIDDMQDNPSTNQFLDLVEKSNMAKVVVSCRIPARPPTYQQQVKVTALDPKYAVEMIRDVGRNIPQIANATEFDLLRINDRLRGHPLSIMIAVPYFDGESFESALRYLPTRVGSGAEIAEGILDWSYGKLSPEEQRFLENASVFYGQVPMGALLDINDGKDRDILAKLVRKNMIEFSPTTNLYSLHPVLREHAYTKLGDRRDEIQIKAATEIAPRIVGGLWSEAARLYEFGVKSAERISNEKLVCLLLHESGDMHHRMGNYDKAKKCQEDALGIAKKLKDQSLEAAALHSLGMIGYSRGNYSEAVKLYNQSLTIARKLGSQSGIAISLHQLAIIEQGKGNYPEAVKLYNQSLTIDQQLGDQSGIATTLHQLASMEQGKGNHPEAVNLYNQSLTIKRKLGNQSGIAITLGALGRLAEGQKDLDAAEKYYQQALEIFEKLGEKPHIDFVGRALQRVRKLKQNPESS